MKKFIAFIVLVAIIVGGYMYQDDIKKYINDYKNGSSDEKIVRNQELLLRALPPKEVEIFEVGESEINISFSKTGTANAKSVVYVSPQTTGIITDINVEVGDKVSKGDVLIELGDSLSTDIADLQYLAAKEGLELANSTLYLTKKVNIESLESAQIGVEAAKNGLDNTKDSRKLNNNLSSAQLDSAEFAVELAEEAYENIKDDYYDAKDTLDDLEDDYDNLREKQPEATDALAQLKTAIAGAEAQVEALKDARENSKNGIEQAELGLEQAEKGLYLQLDQLGFAIKAASTQYDSTINQLETLQLSTQLQELGVEGQIVQANSSYEIAKLNKEYQDIRTPISGVISEVSAVEGNMAAPGQVLVKLENTKKLTIKTSVNDEEASLLKVGDQAKIDGKKGKIISISPTLNQMTKKIDVEIETTADLTPGSFVNVSFSPSPKKTIFVPLNSINLKPEGKCVSVINDDFVVEYKEVETGQIIGDYIEITDGLNGNESIIKALTVYVEEGEKVALAN